MARVQILPEKTPCQMQPWLSPRVIQKQASLLNLAVQGTSSWISYRNSLDMKNSPLSGLVYQQFDCHSLAAQVRVQIKKCMAIDDSSMDLVPTEPLSLSFWAANNLLMDERSRLQLLEQDNIVYRLRTVLDLISKVKTIIFLILDLNINYIFISLQSHRFSCCVCFTPVASHTDVILLCSQGTSLFFNNPRAGMVRKVMTFGQVRNVRVVSRPSIEFTWFPG